MSQLSNYANASAGNKEQRIAKIFAYINTRSNFNSLHLKTLVDVSHETIVGYLKTIQNAQLLTEEYKNHLSEGLESKSYANTNIKSQAEHAQKQYNEWLKRSKRINDLSDERKNQLKQFQFDHDDYVSLNERYNRLELSLLIYSFMKK